MGAENGLIKTDTLGESCGNMETMSEWEYSAHSGLSRWAIQKARKTSRLVVHSAGSMNAAASDVRRGEMTDPDQQRRSTGDDSAF